MSRAVLASAAELFGAMSHSHSLNDRDTRVAFRREPDDRLSIWSSSPVITAKRIIETPQSLAFGQNGFFELTGSVVQEINSVTSGDLTIKVEGSNVELRGDNWWYCLPQSTCWANASIVNSTPEAWINSRLLLTAVEANLRVKKDFLETYAINGLAIELGVGLCKVYATDARRASMVTFDAPKSVVQRSAITITSRAIPFLVWALSRHPEEDVGIGYIGNDVVFFFSDLVFQARQLDGKFPDVESIISNIRSLQASWTYHGVVDDLCKAASTSLGLKHSSAVIEFHSGDYVSGDEDTGTHRANISMKSPMPLRRKFDCEYIRDLLGPVAGNNMVEVRMFDRYHLPIMAIAPLGEESQYCGMLTPMIIEGGEQ